MNISKATTVNVHLSADEIEQILIDHILQKLHSRHMVDMLPDGSLRAHKIEDKGFTKPDSTENLSGYVMTLSQIKEI